MSSYPTRNRKFQKIAKKIKKSKNPHFGNFSSQISWERPRKRENKKTKKLFR